MSNITNFSSLREVAEEFRKDLTGDRNQRREREAIILFAHNGTGKTRLSMEFRKLGKTGDDRDTLYFNAFTEDLFIWDNDLENNTNRVLNLNGDSVFFEGLEELTMEPRIKNFLGVYTDIDFRIDYTNYQVIFSREVTVGNSTQTIENIKISRGEENLFIWCFFLAICELAIDHVKDEEDAGAYSWVKYIYIDDPISSLDENNVIAIGCELANLIKREDNQLKTIISTHHSLFFNVMYNEFGKGRKRRYYFLHKKTAEGYRLQDTNDTPFFHHVAVLSKLKEAVAIDEIYTYHFNALRTILEKTASFFGYSDIAKCIHGLDDEVLFNRALNLMSHGKYSVFDPSLMGTDNKELFNRILDGFLTKYEFEIPEIFNETPPVEE